MAETGLWLLRDAHDQWRATYEDVAGGRGDGEHHRQVALRLHQHAAAVATWARALDDLCGGDPGPMPGYRVDRTDSSGELLDGARYVCNRSVHQLLNLTQSIGGISYPRSYPRRYDEVGIVNWAQERYLPRAETERPGQAALRAAYVARYAGQPVFETLAELRKWFDWKLR
ncbi:hypothetical protein [Pseudonocardia sp. UM4_GMWB1]|uniref:hypothetical protein n=1 Tax=Pseudonocardia sp. UM4_GMWB1 TaxID=2212989 RepID=UPI00307D1923